VAVKSTWLNMHDAKTHLSRHIAALKGNDRIVICNRNRPVAEVRLLPEAKPRMRRPGSAKGLFTVPAAFFEPLPEDLLAGFEGRG
jgi:antitoxin (DNA-binding transcriptional repressor) of toxin-antitoxin stability system